MVLAVAGLPILSDSRTGLDVLASPSAGYFVGFLPGVLVIGLLTARMMPHYRIWPGIAINLTGGVLVVYVCGIAGFMIQTDAALWPAVTINRAFIIGDIGKAVAAALIAAAVHRSRPGLIRPIGPRHATVP